MATITLMVFFSDKGTPKTGLSPVMDGWKKDGTQVITAQGMTEINGGWYYYDFTAYDEAEDYGFRADGTATLNANDRYKYSSNEIGQVTNDLTDVDSKLDRILGLNFHNSAWEFTYTGDEQDGGTIYEYDSAANAATNDHTTGLIGEYSMTCTFVSGKPTVMIITKVS